jgi:hypothetical protein
MNKPIALLLVYSSSWPQTPILRRVLAETRYGLMQLTHRLIRDRVVESWYEAEKRPGSV